jgi:hypothetical protein
MQAPDVGGDDEILEQIIDVPIEHLLWCPRATFSFDGRTEKAPQKIEVLRAILKKPA